MNIFISPTTGGFYHRPGNNDIPHDAVEISTEKYAELLAGLSLGKLLRWNSEQQPALVDPPPVVTDYRLLVANERFGREATGVYVNEILIETSRDSQALISSIGLAAVLDSDYRCNFKTSVGFVEIDAVQIIAMAKAVRAHVQECFDRELELLRAIEAGEFDEDMLQVGWPNPAGTLTTIDSF